MRYHISYTSGATGYGWNEETDSIEDVRHIVNSDSFGRHYTAFVSVWDEVIKDFIFYKRCLTYKAETDLVR